MNANDYNPKLLVEWRKESGKTQTDICAMLNIDRNTVSRAELGKVASFELLAALCRLYGKTIHELVYPDPAHIST